MMSEGKTFAEVEKLAGLLSKGEPAKSPGLSGR